MIKNTEQVMIKSVYRPQTYTNGMKKVCCLQYAIFSGFGGDAFTQNTLFDLDLAIKVRRNITQYPLHHVAYAPAMKLLRPTA